MSTPAVSEAKNREQLHKKFAEMGLRGYWQLERDDHLIFKPVPCLRMTDATYWEHRGRKRRGQGLRN